MPTELKRYQQSGHLHLITFSCHGRLPYLNDPAVRDLFVQSLETMRLRYDYLIVAYVVMPEHVHLLLSEPRLCVLAKALQAIKLSVARRRPERPFWLPRYHGFNVFTEEKQIEKRRYMHRNRWHVAWWLVLRSGRGRAFVIGGLARWVLLRLSRPGRYVGGVG